MKSINPVNGEIIEEFEEFSSDKVSEILSKVNEAQVRWKETSFIDRAKLVKKMADILRERKVKYAEHMAKEMGKPVIEGEAEVEKCAWVCDHYAKMTEEYLKPDVIKTENTKSYVRNDPLGVVLAVMPWNYPFWQVFRFLAPALMAGNGGVLKHASNVMRCALDIEEVVNDAIRDSGFEDAGFMDVFRTLVIGSKQVEAVIRNPVIKAVTLTGSTPAGKIVASTAASEIKKSVLELGGSDPFIVLEDADIPLTCEGAVLGRYQNAGQSCIASKRFIVVEERVKEFEEGYKALVESKVMGDPLNRDTQIGPMCKEEFAKEIEEQVNKSIEMGARLLIGGMRDGAFYKPTILSDVKKGMPVYDEETFGPVAAIISVKNEDEAIEVANDTNFGLGGSIWTKNTEHGEKLAARIETGAVFINSITKSDPRLPFGGVKDSGFGRELSHHGIKEFCNQKTVVVK